MNNSINKKISLMDALLIYINAVFIPSIRYIFKSVQIAGTAAWLSPFASLIVYIPLMYLLYRVMKAFEGYSLYQVMRQVFGSFIGKTIAVILVVWLFILMSLLLRYAGGTLVATTYTGVDVQFFAIIAVTVTAVMLRSGLASFSRMNIFIGGIGLLQFILIIVLLLFGFELSNITPISFQDIPKVFASIISPLTITVTVTFIFIWNDQIRFDKKPAGKFALTAAFITAASTLILLSTIGIFGADLVNKLAIPFYSAVENLTMAASNTVIVSLFILLWTSFEFVLGTALAYMVVRLLREIFNLKRQVPLLTAVMGLTYVFSTYFSNDIFELNTFMQYIEPWFTLTLGVGLPLALFIVAKARKMLPPPPKRIPSRDRRHQQSQA